MVAVVPATTKPQALATFRTFAVQKGQPILKILLILSQLPLGPGLRLETWGGREARDMDI